VPRVASPTDTEPLAHPERLPRTEPHRPAWRRVTAAAFFATVVLAQLAFIVRAYGTPRRELGWQMFAESSQWQADVVRVLADGRRVPVSEPFAGYWWPDLVGPIGAAVPWVHKHAEYGVAATLCDLQGALDWVAANTPRDRETDHYEADVVFVRNRGVPERRHLESARRLPR
jgi:hypothetical protein